MTTSALRTQIELEQPLPNFRIMEEANRVTFVVELGDLYINFGGAATSDGTSMLVPAGTGYTEEDIKITGIISVMRAGTTNGRIRGSIWGR